MKISTFVAPSIGLSVLLGLSAQGATTFSYDFESEIDGDLFTGDVTGWTQDNANPSAFGSTSPLAYIGIKDFGAGASNAGFLGTQFGNTSPNISTTVSGALNVSGAPLPLRGVGVSFNLGIEDNSADAFLGRDGFSVALRDSANANIAQIVLTPTVGDNEVWDVAVGIGNAVPSATSATVNASSGYIFKVDFSAGATDFSYGASGGALPNVPFATLGGVGLSDLGTIAMTHNPLGAEGTSAHSLIFDNIAVSIPEPSSAALLILGSAFLFGRRRS
ncbi:MAG: PEP-CTERM sorting domain-containing protein [Verrucomicrobiales bacterium]